MSHDLWVKYKNYSAIAVPTKDCSHIAHFILAVHRTMSRGKYHACQLALRADKDGPFFEADTPLPAPNTIQTPLLLIVQPSAPQKKARDPHAPVISADESCRKFLNAIAYKLTLYYSFDFIPQTGGPTIEDLLRAKNGREDIPTDQDDHDAGSDEGIKLSDDEIEDEDDHPTWSHNRALRDHYEYDHDGKTELIRRGQPRTNVPLPAIFTPAEWAQMTVMSERTRGIRPRGLCGDMAILPQTCTRYVALPRAEFNDETVALIKSIASKAGLVSDWDKLAVIPSDE